MEIKEIISRIYTQARQLGCCDLFKGTEDYEALVRLFLSPQGEEFCLQHHFPNTATLRLFKPLNPEQYGIYIDAGSVTLKNPKTAVLIGRTVATISCDDLEARHKVVVMHGAKAVINASGWAVVSVKVEAGCSCIKNTSDNAVIL